MEYRIFHYNFKQKASSASIAIIFIIYNEEEMDDTVLYKDNTFSPFYISAMKQATTSYYSIYHGCSSTYNILLVNKLFGIPTSNMNP